VATYSYPGLYGIALFFPIAELMDSQHELETIASIQAVPSILDVVCRATGMGFAAVARVTEDRWLACAVNDQIQFGLKPGGELKVETTICHEIRMNERAVVFDDASNDEVYRDHHTPKTYGLKSYISMPIFLPGGQFWGTLCAIHPHPAKINTPQIVGMFTHFAELIGFHIDVQEKLAKSEADLALEREEAALRERFIGVLGHDLRNPLAAFIAGARLLSQESLSAQGEQVIEFMQHTAHRMKGMIDNLMDFAHGRLGSGLKLDKADTTPLGLILEQVVAEHRALHPSRSIRLETDLEEPIDCDRSRIGQLVSNLLSNAIAYGDDQPIVVRASGKGKQFEIEVANSGETIPPEVMKRLFTPFYRAGGSKNKDGLGLGLYIAAEVAKSHGGTLEVITADRQTRFLLKIPA